MNRFKDNLEKFTRRTTQGVLEKLGKAEASQEPINFVTKMATLDASIDHLGRSVRAVKNIYHQAGAEASEEAELAELLYTFGQGKVPEEYQDHPSLKKLEVDSSLALLSKDLGASLLSISKERDVLAKHLSEKFAAPANFLHGLHQDQTKEQRSKYERNKVDYDSGLRHLEASRAAAVGGGDAKSKLALEKAEETSKAFAARLDGLRRDLEGQCEVLEGKKNKEYLAELLEMAIAYRLFFARGHKIMEELESTFKNLKQMRTFESAQFSDLDKFMADLKVDSAKPSSSAEVTKTPTPAALAATGSFASSRNEDFEVIHLSALK